MIKLLKICAVLVPIILIASVAAIAQSQTDAERAAQAAIRQLHSRDVPEASLPCTPDEAKWWSELRKVASAFNQAEPDKPDTKKFNQLIKEGIEKAYQIPIPDRYALILWRARPPATPKKINGSIALAVELLPDGTVGEVKIAQGLDPGIDKMAIDATRKLVFLPAIKNRKFVSLWLPMTMSYSSYETFHR
jgi:TonB family protein